MTSRYWRALLKSAATLAVAMAPAFALAQATANKAAPAKAATTKAVVNESTCTSCHSNIGDFHKQGAHKKVSCASCHDGLDKHLADSKARPATSMDSAKCGSCHKNQFDSMYKISEHRKPRDSKKNANGMAPNPFFEQALGAHGFTKEHNLPRGHAFGALDQYVADRTFGGRFEPKEGWLYLSSNGGNIKVWDVIKDNYPDNSDQKAFKPGTAAAANPVCWTCKSTDLILEWAYLGDAEPSAKWSRTSKVVDLVKNVNHSLNCNFCHDPHSAKPRIVRDALIQAVTRTDFPTLYSEDPKRTKIDVKDLGLRGHTRKIAMLEKYDGKLQCGQCHVEYNCNPGTDPKTGQPITMADKRTNLFPFVGIDKIDQFYEHASFKDFKHPKTGALLTKMQHPDSEIYWGSKHDKAGVDCANCHMPKVKDKKTGKTYTSHWATSPREYVKETCLTCHTDKSEKQMTRTMDGMTSHFNSKLREAEHHMSQLFAAFDAAQEAGVDEAVLVEARKQHSIAHTNWEWWTAANGAAFHNLDQAKTSLAKSVGASQAGIKMLKDGIAAKKKLAVAPALAPVVAKK
ncbi:MAG: ammonia-forming cytochrome c nitrite reductase subunit c552 [Burkholderiaceae bacterium]